MASDHPVAFRVCFGLFCMWFAQITFVFTGVIGRWLPDEAIMWQILALEPVTSWVGRHVLGVDAVLHRDSGSGDQAAVWVGVFCVLVAAAIVTAVWSMMDRRRTDTRGYPRGSWSSGCAWAARCCGTASPKSFRRKLPPRL